MKLIKNFMVGEREFELTGDSVVLETGSSGRAIFSVIADVPLSGCCSLKMGYPGQVARYFSGVIRQSVAIDSRQQRLTVCEYPAALNVRLPLMLRNVTAREVLQALSSRSGVAFRTGTSSSDAVPAWLERKAGHFVTLGSGFESLNRCMEVFGVSEPVLLSQPDGSLYVGRYADAGASRQLLQFDTRFFTQLSVSGADCPVIPTLRPGQRIAIGSSEPLRVSRVTIAGLNMRINF